jgi:predicted nucleic acid-binding protein
MPRVSSTPTPYIIDTRVLIDIARGDADLIGLLQDYDQTGQPLVIPALAAVGALLDARADEASALLAGLATFESVEVAPLDGVEQAAKIADVIARTDLTPWDAHVAAVADVAVCPILTFDASRWEEVSRSMGDRLFTIEIADPDQ